MYVSVCVLDSLFCYIDLFVYPYTTDIYRIVLTVLTL